MAQEIADSKLIDTWSSSGLKVKPDISKIIEGWQLGEQPPHEYMNWLQNTFGSKLNHILKNGVAKWNNETEYLAGATIQHNGNIWICKTTNTNSEPTAFNNNWDNIPSLENLPLTVDTINDFPTGATTGNTCIVKDLDRGGIFIYDSTKVSEHNGGTNFNGWIRQYSGAINVKWFSASKSKTTTENKIIIENTINTINDTEVYIPYDINYGYKKIDTSTFLNITSSTNKLVVDVSPDNSYGGSGTGARGGAQERKIMYTPNEQDGDHDAFYYMHSKWHTGLSISHNGGDEMKVENGGMGKNRRASIFFGVKGTPLWRIGQGLNTSDTLSDSELAQFGIAVNGIPDLGVTDLSTCYAINRTNGYQGWNTNTPRMAFDFISRAGQPGGDTFGFENKVPNTDSIFLMKNTSGKELRIINPYNSNGFKIANETGTLLDCSSNGRTWQIYAKEAGQVAIIMNSITSSRNIVLREDTNRVSITTTLGGTGFGFNADGSSVAGGTILATLDNAYNLGGASERWSTIYAGTGTINTSDDREKVYFDTTETERLVALELKENMKKFKFNDSISEKGEEKARIHFGASAQTVKSIFEKYGLNAFDYALLCYDEWEEQEEVKDEDGNIIDAYRPSGNRYGIRYEELLCFIISAM